MPDATKDTLENPLRFIADVHLGSLAKSLRMAGLDVLYQNNFSKTALLHLAYHEARILLSKNASLAANPFINFYLVQSQNPAEQIKEIINHFNLQKALAPFTRCIMCNALLQAVNKSEIEDHLPEGTKQHFQLFWQCPNCGRIYWQGSHYERMLKTVESLGLQ